MSRTRTPFPRLGRWLRPAGLALACTAAACAVDSPFQHASLLRVDRSVTPSSAAANWPRSENREVLWGGRIASGINLSDSTELTVLAYPLTDAGVPDADDAFQGRFVVVQRGYLEMLDYAPDRAITVHGRVVAVREVSLGETTQQVPVVAPVQLRLWPVEPARAWWPSLHFGFSIMGGF